MKHILTFSFLLFILTGNLISQDVILNVVEADGANTGSITAIVNNPQFTYTFEWYDSDGNLINPQPNCDNSECTLSGLNPGRYCVRITSSGSDCDEDSPSEAYGCVDVEGVSCDNELTYFLDTSEPICSNEETGFIKISLGLFSSDPCWQNEPVFDHTIEWENGSGASLQEDLPPGKYCVTVTASPTSSCPDCYAYICGIIPSIEEEDILIEGDVVDASDCDLSDGSISVSISGGAAPYSTKWLGLNQSGNTLSGLAKGVYCVEVIDNCENKVVKCFEVDDNCDDDCDPLEVNVSVTQHRYCELTRTLIPASISVSVSGGSGNYNYSVVNTWSGQVYNYVPKLTMWDWGEFCVVVTDPDCDLISEEICVVVQPVVYLDKDCLKGKWEMKGFTYDTEEFSTILSQNGILQDSYVLDNGRTTLTRNYNTPEVLISAGVDNIEAVYDVSGMEDNNIVLHAIIVEDKIGQRSFTYDLLGKSDILKQEVLTVFPNPNSGQFTLQFYFPLEDNISFEINSIEGKEVYSGTIETTIGINSQELDLSGFNDGIYFLTIDNRLTQKVIINK